ncbi:nucleotidyltransferase [Bacillus cereus]|nr:nucleotidyltransferase [Bacillus thuringiensis]PEU38711.1 nucleotidyltransferase [Bacillus cereus]PFV77131.1 nucleotidyltransferase [Bacillus thuringiensis]PFW30442.1 nucleotidyltransferase [Bacillus cereus]
MALNKKDSVIQKIIYHIELFESFENVYLFGSIINEKRTPNDIDLLLIYKDFSSRLLIDLDKISTIFNQLYEISFDLTVLSEHEEDESSFIIRLNSNYLRLK